MDASAGCSCLTAHLNHKRAAAKREKEQAMHGTGSNRIAALADGLNQLLANYFALYVQTKSHHWHVTGPHFFSYHALFDTQAQDILATTDAIAERVRKLGRPTLHSIGEIARNQSIEESDHHLSAEAMLEGLQRGNARLVRQLKELKALCRSVDDNATEGLIDSWTEAAETRLWYLSATAGGEAKLPLEHPQA